MLHPAFADGLVNIDVCFISIIQPLHLECVTLVPETFRWLLYPVGGLRIHCLYPLPRLKLSNKKKRFGECKVIPSLPLLPGPLWPKVVVIVRVPSMNQILLLNICIWNTWYPITMHKLLLRNYIKTYEKTYNVLKSQTIWHIIIHDGLICHWNPSMKQASSWLPCTQLAFSLSRLKPHLACMRPVVNLTKFLADANYTKLNYG